ncbi:MAG: hypothetical protein ACO4CW_10915, partial [Planctomycetota bacterium]
MLHADDRSQLLQRDGELDLELGRPLAGLDLLLPLAAEELEGLALTPAPAASGVTPLGPAPSLAPPAAAARRAAGRTAGRDLTGEEADPGASAGSAAAAAAEATARRATARRASRAARAAGRTAI